VLKKTQENSRAFDRRPASENIVHPPDRLIVVTPRIGGCEHAATPPGWAPF
jgi:hypothetical protein